MGSSKRLRFTGTSYPGRAFASPTSTYAFRGGCSVACVWTPVSLIFVLCVCWHRGFGVGLCDLGSGGRDLYCDGLACGDGLYCLYCNDGDGLACDGGGGLYCLCCDGGDGLACGDGLYCLYCNDGGLGQPQTSGV